MAYEVKIKKKVARKLKKLPVNVQKMLFLLVEDLKADGPIQKKLEQLFPFGRPQLPLPFKLSLCGMLDSSTRGNRN
jgi:hypothetical protein